MIDLKVGDVLNKTCYWKRAVKLTKIKDNLSMNAIAHELGDSRTNPYLINLINFFEKHGLILVDSTRFPYIYKINVKKIAEFLRHGENFKLSVEIIYLTNAFTNVGVTAKLELED